jgi:hypothetical protein
MSRFFGEMMRGVEKGVETDGAWLICESAIVADVEDPDRQHRIKVILTAIDPDNMFDDWVRPASQVCLGNGYGAVFLPQKGQEVFVTGVLGQKYNLVYHGPVYNESMKIPADFEDSTVSGFRVPGDFKIIAELDAQIRAGRISIEADGQINIIAPGGFFVNGKKI